MTGLAHVRGHADHWDRHRKCWVYDDTNEPVDMQVPFGGAGRGCYGCGAAPTPVGHDACIADLPGVRFACCGHGNPLVTPYVQFNDGRYLRAGAALGYFQSQGRTVGA